MPSHPKCQYSKHKKKACHFDRLFFHEPEGIRTPDPRLRRPLLYPAELPIHVLTQDILCHSPFHLSTTFLIFFKKFFRGSFQRYPAPTMNQFMRLKCSAFQYSMIAPSTFPFSMVRMPKVGRPPPLGREMLPGLNRATCQLSSHTGIWV